MPRYRGLLALMAGLILGLSPGRAGAVPVVFGASWDGPDNELQKIVDSQYGVGHINVQTDYEGANPGEPDPWFWSDDHFSALMIREIAGNANHNVLGWYLEPDGGSKPVIDGVDDGVVFDGPAGTGATAVVNFSQPAQKFGFYLDPNGSGDATNAPQPELFFTNRGFNDEGPDGSGALHHPFGGDIQALVYNVSAWTQPNTWLVCFEDLDSGADPGPCCDATDNDFNDLVFEVQAFGPSSSGATPVLSMSFGALKVKYRR